MAKDDYDVILYRILVYLYACKKRKIAYNSTTFREAVSKGVQNDQWLYDVIDMAQGEGLIEGASFQKAWGGDKVPLFGFDELDITAAGIRYLKESGTMKKIGETLKEAVDTISKLAAIALIG